MCLIAAEGQSDKIMSDKIMSDTGVHMKQRCGTELLQVEKNDIH